MVFLFYLSYWGKRVNSNTSISILNILKKRTDSPKNWRLERGKSRYENKKEVRWELYNLKEDPKEQNNLAIHFPEIIEKIDSFQQTAHRQAHIREWEFVNPKFKR